jgi:hypothetical protein
MVDQLQVAHLDLMKIDAEGAEHLIFKGGREAIQKHSPDMICEFLKGAKSAEIQEMLSSMGYRYFAINEKNMTVDPVQEITVGEDMHTLNTLITKKTSDQIRRILSNKM